MHDFLGQLFPNFPTERLRSMIEKATAEVIKCTDQASRMIFYSYEYDLNFAGDALSKIDVSRHDLLQTEQLQEKVLNRHEVESSLTNAVIVDLELFRKKENLTMSMLTKWLECFSKQAAGSVDEKDVTAAVKRVMKEYTAMNKSKKRSPEKLTEFMSKPFMCHLKVKPNQCTSSHSSSDSDINPVKWEITQQTPDSGGSTMKETKAHESRDLSLKVCNQAKRLQKQKGELEEQSKQIEDMSTKITILQDQLRDGIEKNKELHKDLQENVQCISELRNELSKEADVREKLTLQKNELHTELRKVKQAPFYKRLYRKEDNIRQAENIIKEHRDNNCERRIKSLKKKVKNVQTILSNCKKTLKKYKVEVASLRNKAKEDNATLAELTFELEERDKETVETRTGKRFSDNIVKCVIQLVGEAEVPANRCREVIKIVCLCLFGKDIDLHDLPSERSVLRFADQGHFLAKYHLADSVSQSDRFDYHLDGTSKDHRKYVGSQLTLNTGETMSAGYSTVFREDTETLLEQAVDLFKEVGNVYDENEAKEQYKNILFKLSGIMSDRASVMKSFDKDFECERSKVLCNEKDYSSVNFLHCNAHFLLGLSTVCEKVLKKEETDLGKNIGRDMLPVFNRFKSSSECSAARYIRTACDILGPRGDEKNGCRDSWAAYCHMKEIKSRITMYY